MLPNQTARPSPSRRECRPHVRAPSSAPTGTATPPGPVPKGLEKFYSQQLAWGACSSYATDADSAKLYASSTVQCARLTVPLAYANPTGQTVQVGVLRKVATDPAARIGSLVTDPGGPGSLRACGWLASYVVNSGSVPQPHRRPAAIRSSRNSTAKFDLVGIDPRGIGSSLPVVACQTNAEKDASRATDRGPATRPMWTLPMTATKKLVDECVANTGKSEGIDGKTFLANIGTRDVARDMDVLRAVLGDAKLTYLGFSYGTEIGLGVRGAIPDERPGDPLRR